MKKLIFSLAFAVSVHAFAQQYNIPAVSPRQTVVTAIFGDQNFAENMVDLL